jgi:hypothetical protein
MVAYRRERRILKWAGLVLSLLILVMWAVASQRSFYYAGHWSHPAYPLDGYCVVATGKGLWWFGDVTNRSVGFSWCERHPGFDDSPGLPRTEGWDDRYVFPIAPVWLLFLVVALPTGLLWWRDRRPIAPGHCRKCGYNLTGNVGGVCPECGERI